MRLLAAVYILVFSALGDKGTCKSLQKLCEVGDFRPGGWGEVMAWFPISG